MDRRVPHQGAVSEDPDILSRRDLGDERSEGCRSVFRRKEGAAKKLGVSSEGGDPLLAEVFTPKHPRRIAWCCPPGERYTFIVVSCHAVATPVGKIRHSTRVSAWRTRAWKLCTTRH